jgi:hypothetical protein
MLSRAVGVALVVAALSTSKLAIAQVTPAATPASLEGVWASETTFGPRLRGQLRVTRGDSTWRAVISSAETRFRVRGDSVRFSFGDGMGEFRGRLESRGRTIDGFWIQPRGVVLPYPFATPLKLSLVQSGVWQGTVVPLMTRSPCICCCGEMMPASWSGPSGIPSVTPEAALLSFG